MLSTRRCRRSTRSPPGSRGTAPDGVVGPEIDTSAGAFLHSVGLPARGGPVLGVCNGFQILCGAGVLPGALVRNRELKFVCEDVTVSVEDPGGFRSELPPGRALVMPVKHGEGAYVPDPLHKPRV